MSWFLSLLNCKRYHCDRESISGRSRISQTRLGGGRQPFGQFLLKLHENVNTIGPKKGDNAPVNPRKTNKSFFKCTWTYMLKQIYISVEWRALQSTSRPTHKQMWDWLYTLGLWLLLALLVVLSIWVLRGRLWVRSVLWTLWRWSTIKISKIIPIFTPEHLWVSVKKIWMFLLEYSPIGSFTLVCAEISVRTCDNVNKTTVSNKYNKTLTQKNKLMHKGMGTSSADIQRKPVPYSTT